QVLLFSSARAQLVREVIRPALEAGKIVIADRFFDSTVVYQGHGHGVSLQAIREVTTLAVGTLVPDRTFLLDVPVEVGLTRSGWRAEARWDRFEADATDFHVRVRDAYLRPAAAEPQRLDHRRCRGSAGRRRDRDDPGDLPRQDPAHQPDAADHGAGRVLHALPSGGHVRRGHRVRSRCGPLRAPLAPTSFSCPGLAMV